MNSSMGQVGIICVLIYHSCNVISHNVLYMQKNVEIQEDLDQLIKILSEAVL